MDFLVILIGAYFLIKIILDDRKSKKFDARMDDAIRAIKEKRESVNNYYLNRQYLCAPIKYSDVRGYIVDAMNSDKRISDIRNSVLFGANERNYIQSIDDIIVGDARNIAIALIMSDKGFLPMEWQLNGCNGMRLGDLRKDIRKNKELFALGRKIQNNLLLHDKEFHVAVMPDSKTPYDISNATLGMEEFRVVKDSRYRIDNINLDNIVTSC